MAVGTSTKEEVVLTHDYVAGMGIWSTYTLSQTAKGDLLILADVTVRVRYFFVLTFCVTLMCAGEYPEYGMGSSTS